MSGDAEHMRAYQNALSLGTDATAGYLTAPVEFREELIRGLDNLLFMRRLSGLCWELLEMLSRLDSLTGKTEGYRRKLGSRSNRGS